MNIKRAKQEIKDAIEAYLARDAYGEYQIPSFRQRPVLLIGAPGIGKTQIMEQIAKECGVGLVAYTITHHTRQSAIGLPFISQKEFGGRTCAVTEYTMSEIVASVYEKIEKTGLKEGILFIDEINCVSETLAPAMLQFLQCKTFGNHAVPEGWIIVAAGNPPEYNKSVREFDVVTMDRVKRIEVEPDYEVWKEYAYQEEIHPAVISYLNTKPRYFYRMESTVDGKFFATPRGWEDLSRLISVYEKLGKQVDREVTIQYIQYPKAAKDFANYLELYYKYQTDYQIDAVLGGKIDEILLKKTAHASFDEKLSVIGLLTARCVEHFRQVCRQEETLEKVFACLKEGKERLFSGAASDMAVCLKEESDKLAYECERKREAELLTRTERETYRRAGALLETYERAFAGEHLQDKEEAFGKLKSLFVRDQDTYEELICKAGRALEHAFDFMEAAFGDSQEMVVFVTELTANYYCVKFLQSYDCPRYYRYNERLLFEKNQQNILEKLERL